MSVLLHTVWLSLACTPGSESFAKLLNKYKTPSEIFYADSDGIASAVGSKSREFSALCDKSTERAEEIIDFCKNKKVGILTYFDSDFPDSLRKIKNPPVLLYYRGVLPDFKNEFFVSIVGTRHLSDYGRKNTFRIATDIARAGATVVSGMAIGIDGVALSAALAQGKSTVAVIGSGIDVCYPSQHKRLAQEIVKSGCVFTEYAPGTRPQKYNFPKRNRIISALSSAVIVMEGRERSGAVITARYAKEQGRAVYAFPGNVGNSGSEASNLLIKNGAKLLTSADDILRDFEKISLGRLNPFTLTEPIETDMASVLNSLQVSCIAPSDDIFKPARKKANKKTSESTSDSNADNLSLEQKEDNSAEEKKLLSRFNASIVRLYNKIPHNSEASVDSLVDDEHTLKEVMQGILKLEIASLVTVLPGDRVKRNF